MKPTQSDRPDVALNVDLFQNIFNTLHSIYTIDQNIIGALKMRNIYGAISNCFFFFNNAIKILNFSLKLPVRLLLLIFFASFLVYNGLLLFLIALCSYTLSCSSVDIKNISVTITFKILKEQ